MPYSAFKKIEQVEEQFGIIITQHHSLFADTEKLQPSQYLKETLRRNISLALNINTEKARSEFIIAPLLLEVREQLQNNISLFSGIEFNVEAEKELNGFCDYILSLSPNQAILRMPVVCVVEAKNEQIKSGYAQCIAEMIAAKQFNDKKSKPLKSILGVVTTGSNWKFMTLQNNNILIDFEEYLIGDVDKILGIFKTFIDSC
ncbi:hypothetical protein [Candidatus Parabeggiatoa sp. HSG14]|uniref:hypothetical protein n=1 Tax=Candidatus Parabeggiatoa sp. HSG14 TaxID=3055593 RepID=UPI0025A731BB|nr:hypothetical protein [Thiotrichales bacterium HSG14]